MRRQYKSQLTIAEIWARLEKEAYHWDNKEERVTQWDSYGYFYRPISSRKFKIYYTRQYPWYDVVIVSMKESPDRAGTILTITDPWLHQNSEENDAEDMVRIHLVRRDGLNELMSGSFPTPEEMQIELREALTKTKQP